MIFDQRLLVEQVCSMIYAMIVSLSNQLLRGKEDVKTTMMIVLLAKAWCIVVILSLDCNCMHIANEVFNAWLID